MPKKLLQDMVKVKRASGGVRKSPKETSFKPIPPIETYAHKPRYAIWFVATFSILFCVFAISYLFSQAVVTVNPKIQNVVLDENFSAIKNSDDEDLSFDLVVISGEESKTIKADSEKDVSDVAVGMVLIYNAFGYAPQPLAVDTRLEGSNGKMYKTKTKTVVPGMSAKGVPGSVEVKIYASAAGAGYNSGPLDFQIFGFKGTPKYSKFYARSKGEITGGFVGKAPVVSDAEKAEAVSGLKTALQAKLLKQATEQIPPGFVLFKDAIFLSTNNANNEQNTSAVYNKDNSMTLTLKGSLSGVLFNEQKLTKKVVSNNIPEYDGSPLYISNLRDLNFSLPTQVNLSNDIRDLSFNLKGNAKIVWKLDENKLINDLLGKSKKDFSAILLQYPYIDSADVVTTPFWMKSMPEKSKDIKVIVNYPK